MVMTQHIGENWNLYAFIIEISISTSQSTMQNLGRAQKDSEAQDISKVEV